MNWRCGYERSRARFRSRSQRAALRVLPILQLEKRDSSIRDLVLPVFRATVASWDAAKYPAREQELSTTCRAAAALVAQSTGHAWRSAYATAASRAAEYAAVVTIRDTASSEAANAAGAAVDAVDAFGTGFSLAMLGFATALGAKPAAAALWSAVSTDATRVEGGTVASGIAGLPLWPLDPPGTEPLASMWREMKAALLAANQDWQVWTDWYEDHLARRVRDEERELAYVRIEESVWDHGPATVNAEIKRRIGEPGTWANTLANMPEVPLGNKWTESGDRLAIDPTGQETDDTAALDPVVRQLHETVRRKAIAFATNLAGIEDRIG